MKPDAIVFPILCIGKDGSITCTDRDLGRCSYQAVRNRYFDNLHLLDSGGDSYRITEWGLKERMPWWLRLYYLLRNPELEVAIRGIDKTDHGLDGIKEMARQTVTAHLEFYDAGGDADRLLSNVKRSETPGDLMHLFREF